MKSLSARNAAYAALGAALLAVCSWISIPLTIPITLQTFAVCLISAILGLPLAIWSILVWILLGAVGVPVFSGFRAGLGVLLGTTGGYIIGFFFTALIVGLAVRRFGRSRVALAISMALGILVCYAFGTVWFMIVYARSTGPIGLISALSWCVFPYLLPDAVKIVLAIPLSIRLAKAIR